MELGIHVTDEREAMERMLLQFSHFKKKAEKLNEKEYKVTLSYQKEDKRELIIRILSFGPMLKVISPPEVIKDIKERIQAQLDMQA